MTPPSCGAKWNLTLEFISQNYNAVFFVFLLKYKGSSLLNCPILILCWRYLKLWEMYRTSITLSTKFLLVNLILPGSTLKMCVILYVFGNINIRMRKKVCLRHAEIEEYVNILKGFFLSPLFPSFGKLCCFSLLR